MKLVWDLILFYTYIRRKQTWLWSQCLSLNVCGWFHGCWKLSNYVVSDQNRNQLIEFCLIQNPNIRQLWELLKVHIKSDIFFNRVQLFCLWSCWTGSSLKVLNVKSVSGSWNVPLCKQPSHVMSPFRRSWSWVKPPVVRNPVRSLPFYKMSL